MPPQPIHPTLIKAAEEIHAILKRHDLAGIVNIMRPGGVQSVRELSPSWSCARIEQTTAGPCIALSANREDFAFEETRQKVIKDTVEMLLTLEHLAEQDGCTMRGVVEAVAKQTGMDIQFRIEQA